jgi:predicted amidohydrolase
MSLHALITQAHDILGLATKLLHTGRKHRADFSLLRNRPENVFAYNSLVMRSEEIFRSVRGERLEPEVRSRLLLLLEEFQRTPEVIRAKALALALDNAVGHRLARSFRNQRLELSSGDAVPICQPRLKEIFGQDLSAQPKSSAELPDRIPHLGLLPEDLADFQIVLDSRPADQSCLLLDLQNQILATGVPNRSEEEFLLEIYGDSDLARFFRYGPKDSASQRERLVRLLRRAAEEGASILVFPELCADGDCIAALTQAFHEAPATLRLLVAGSHHIKNAEELRNECVALVRGYHRPLTHSKFAPYVLKQGPGQPEAREGLSPHRRTLTLFLTDDWSFTLLVCKDLLDPDVDRLLKSLGTSLLFVPALTAKISQFKTYTAALAHANQAIVVVANNPIFSEGDPIHSIFSVPRQSDDNQRVDSTHDHAPPGVCCYRLSDASLSWIA